MGVDRRGHTRDGGPGHGPDSDSGLGTLELTLPTSILSHTYPSLDMFIPPHTCTSPRGLQHAGPAGPARSN